MAVGGHNLGGQKVAAEIVEGMTGEGVEKVYFQAVEEECMAGEGAEKAYFQAVEEEYFQQGMAGDVFQQDKMAWNTEWATQ